MDISLNKVMEAAGALALENYALKQRIVELEGRVGELVEQLGAATAILGQMQVVDVPTDTATPAEGAANG